MRKNTLSSSAAPLGRLSKAIGGTALIVAIVVGAPAGRGQDIPGAEQALRTFRQNVDRYVAVRQQALRPIPPVTVGGRVAVVERLGAMRAAIQKARAGAGAGDIFSPDTHPVFRQLLAQTLEEHQIDVDDLLAELLEDVPPGAPLPEINQRFFWGLGAAIPPCVLAALPRLPREVRYRFAGADLVLIDLDTELVLDILPHALASVAHAAGSGLELRHRPPLRVAPEWRQRGSGLVLSHRRAHRSGDVTIQDLTPVGAL